MGTKSHTDTTQTNQYNTASMGTYNALQPGIQSGYKSLMGLATNPFSSPIYNAMLGVSNRQINTLGQGMNQNLFGNIRAGGGLSYGANMPGFLQSNLLANQRALSGMRSNAAINTALGLQGMGVSALNSAAGYRPLQTGATSNTTQYKTGVGTWLGPAIGAGLALATGGMSAGLTGALGGLASFMGSNAGGGGGNSGGGGNWNSLITPGVNNPNFGTIQAPSLTMPQLGPLPAWMSGSPGGF